MPNVDTHMDSNDKNPHLQDAKFTKNCTAFAAGRALDIQRNAKPQQTQTAPELKDITPDHLDNCAFEDVAYFTATSSLRLAQITDVLAAVEIGEISKEQLSHSAGMLAGLCRSVSETQEALRQIAKTRLAHHCLPTPRTNIPVARNEPRSMDSAMRRLIPTVDEMLPADEVYAGPDFRIAILLPLMQRQG